MVKRKTRTIKVLSVRQPHADHIFWYGKWCENRNWPTDHRGELFIHASSFDNGLQAQCREFSTLSPGGCRTGAILGRVQLIDCVEVGDLQLIREGQQPVPKELQALAVLVQDLPPKTWEFVFGRWCWIVQTPQPLREPIVCKGALKLWSFDAREEQLRFLPVPDPLPELPMLSAGVEPARITKTMLFRACENGDLDVVRMALEASFDVETCDADGYSILGAAADSGRLEVIEFLLDKGADPNNEPANGYTPLESAASLGCTAICEKLLACGAHKSHGSFRDSAYRLAVEGGHLETAEAIKSWRSRK